MTVDIYRRLVKVYDNNDELIHTYKRLSEWGLREDGSIKSPIDFMLEYFSEKPQNPCCLSCQSLKAISRCEESKKMKSKIYIFNGIKNGIINAFKDICSDV